MMRPAPKTLMLWCAFTAGWFAAGWASINFVVGHHADTLSLHVFERTFQVLAPEYAGLLLIAVPAVVVIARFGLSNLPGYQRFINLALRIGVLTAVVASLTQIVVVDFDSRLSTIYLVDTSASSTDEALDRAADYVNETVDHLEDGDQIQVIAFADRPYVVEPDADGYYAEIPRPDADDHVYDTDISAAVRMSYGLFPDDHLRRAVLLTDGNQTHGDLVAEADRAADFGIRLFTQRLDVDRPPEVLIQRLEADDQIDAGAPFRLRARLFSTHQDTVDLELWRDEYLDTSRTVDVQPGITEVEFDTEVSEPGFRHFELKMEVHGEDTHRENNHYVYTVWVSGPPRVLYIEGEMRARHHLQQALVDTDFDVEPRSPVGLPTDFDELDQFDLVLLSDVHADDVSHHQMELLDEYVRRGGGLIKAGGENSFGPGGWQHTPIEDLMPVTFEGRQRRDDPSVAILLVIDRSGSMEEHRRIELARQAAREAVRELDTHAEIGVLVFDHEVDVVTPIQPVTNRARILDQIDGIRIRGGTDIALALREAYDKIGFHPARFRHVLLLTDGIAPEDDIFTQTMPAMRADDITVSTIAVGADAETSLMRRVADAGNGRFYFTNRAADIPRIFVDETTFVTQSALVEEPVTADISTPDQALHGIDWDHAPYLMGYVSTTPRADSTVLLQTEHGEPLLARGRVGLGRTAAFTSDVKTRWATRWIQWDGFAQMWAQLIRSTMRTDDRDRLPMTAEIDGHRGRVVVDALDGDDRFINDLDSEVHVTSPEGDKTIRPFHQTAPGRYETDFELDEFGSYQLAAHHRLDGEQFAVSQSSLSYPYPRGLSFIESNEALLKRVVELTGGDTDADVGDILDRRDEQIRYQRHLWPYLAALAALLMVLDLGFRRVRLSTQTHIRWDELVD